MSTYLSHLQNEAILLMYLANELPAEDRAEVEAMLAQDETLKGQLAELRAAYASLDSAMGRADQQTPLPNTFAAARAVGDMVRNRHHRAAEVLDYGAGDGRSRLLRWAIYPVAAAALLAIGMLVWWRVASADVGAPAVPQYAERYRPPLLDFSRTVAGDIDQMSDEQLAAMFDPIVVERSPRSQREYSALNYLNEPMQ